MPIIEVNHVTKEYQLGQLQSLKNTALNQWRRLTGQPVEERAPFKALETSLSRSVFSNSGMSLKRLRTG